MKAYSEDLRAKILEAIDRGMPKSEAARAFGVSRSSVKRYAAARREGRPLAPKKHPGSKPKLDERARKLLEADVEDRPAATLKHRCRFLRACYELGWKPHWNANSPVGALPRGPPLSAFLSRS
jgi:transposase